MLQVVAGWLETQRGSLLLTQRPADKSFPGCFEFPGGKVHAGESDVDALVREFQEELGLAVQVGEYLGSYSDPNAELPIELRLYRVTATAGSLAGLGPVGLENQAIRLAPIGRLQRLPLPSLDRPAVREHALTRRLVISPEPTDHTLWLRELDATLSAGAKLIMLRAKKTPLHELRHLIVRARDRTAAHGGELLLQDDAELAERWRLGGVSLTSQALMRCKARPLPKNFWLCASCHSEDELAQAQAIDCDFVTLAPVQPTATHPGQAELGWARVQALARQFPALSIFALGGLQPSDLAKAHSHGAFGIAGIRAFWHSTSNHSPVRAAS